MELPFALTLAAEHAGTPEMSWFFDQMDMPGKIIVGILIVCSFIGWGAMIGKYLDVSAMRKRNLGYELRLRKVGSILSLESVSSANLAPYEYLTFEATQAFKKHRGRIRSAEDIALCMGHVENAIQRGIARNVQKYEEKMILLSSLVSGGPFLGLLGTVWGVMLTFGALGTSEKASIAQLAPGVSGALVATTFGLLVAIPATFGYNYLLSHTKVMTTELENFASSLADRIELELQESARRNRDRNARAAAEAAPERHYADEGDAPRDEPLFESPRTLRPSRPVSVRDDEPAPRPAPTSADFGPDASGYDDDFVAPPRRDNNPAPRPGSTRLRDVRSWDEVE